MADPKEILFLRVVEAGSFKAAAEQMSVDASAVSRGIAALETRLGVRLLQRSTRRSIPTEAGERYFAGLRRIIDEQLALEGEVAGLTQTPSGRLRIAAPVDFGARYVAPVVAGTHEDYPDLAIDLVLGSRFADLIEGGIDIAVRIGDLPDSSLIAKGVGAVPRMVAASAAYIAANGRPDCPADLAGHPFIFYGSAHRELTIAFGREGREETVTVRGRITANSVTAIRRFVSEGCGMHLGPVWAFEDGLADGSIVRVLPSYDLKAFPLHLVYAASDFLPAKVRTFIDRFAATAAETAIMRGG